ncbi:hypothetical protein HKCCE3408_14440 [Rhodobacterales bacterium HKCCE3408]|nr:hypothetical protein [Rhodobacterales bacterium HKCCE3408]
MNDDQGAVTVPFVLWLPFLMAIIIFVADLSFIMYNRADAVRVIEDVNRMRAIGLVTSSAAVEQEIADRLRRADGSEVGTVHSDVFATVITSRVDMPVANIDMFGVIARATGNVTIEVESRQVIENLGV